MTFIKMPLKDAVAPEALPEGPYTLILESVDKIEDPDGKTYLQIRHSVVGEPDAAAVFHRLNITLPEDPNKAKWSMLFCKAYLKAFGFPYEDDGWDDEEIVPGAQAQVFLERSEYNGIVSNRIKLNIQDV